ncbi:MAG: LLM class flavin-dependent oxidoreductase [Candidatus Heimdallarchaeota archaeon]|nr:LLM class flavin-dependent oxidoreductase [Candidatus Heimdallarchaeota archaeon]
MEIGLVLSSDYLPAKTLIKIAPLIDALGYSQVSVPEIWGHDAFSLLSILTSKTRNARLATGIVNMFSRTPATMAMTAASIDEVSRGRFVLGLGLSGPHVIENLHGMPYYKPITRSKEYIQSLRTLFAGERLNFDTQTLGTYNGFKLSIKKMRSDIPIHIAALGPKNIELTAKLADGWIPVTMPLPAFEEQVKDLMKNVPADRKDSFAITPFILTMLGDTEDRLNLLRGHLAYYFGGMGDFYNNMLKRMGFVDEADTIKELWSKNKRDEAARAVNDELLSLTSVFGDKEELHDKMSQYVKAGATTPLVALPFKTSFKYAEGTLKAMAPNSMLSAAGTIIKQRVGCILGK